MKFIGSSASHRTNRSTLARLATLATALTLSWSACGKDKPPEETPTEATPAADETPSEASAETPTSTEDAGSNDATNDRADDLRTRMDPKLAADDPKSRLRAGRERPGRRPGSIRHGRDGEGEGVEKRDEVKGDPTVGADDPGTVGTPGPSEPTPSIPTDPMAAEPTPSEPVPAPAIEIRNDAAALDAAAMLPLVTVSEVTTQALAPGVPLQGIAVAASYGSIFYAASDSAKFGVALQAWQDPTLRESEDRFRRMFLQYPNAENVSVLAPAKAFFAYFGKIQSLTWVEPNKRMVMSVTCGESVCNHDQLVRLAKTAGQRM